MDDIKLLVDSFYGKTRADARLAGIFNGVIQDHETIDAFFEGEKADEAMARRQDGRHVPLEDRLLP